MGSPGRAHLARLPAPRFDLGLRDTLGAFDGWVPLTAEVIATKEPGSLLAAAISVVDPEVRADELAAVIRRWSSEVELELERVVPLGEGFRVLLATHDHRLSSDDPAVSALSRAIVWSRLRSSGVVSVRAWGEAVVGHASTTGEPAVAAGSIRRGDWDRFEIPCRTADGREWVAYIDPTGARPPEALRI